MTNYIEEPMGDEKTTLGGIHISPNAVATIAYYATLQSYGVVGLAPKNLADGIVSTITREPSRGISVRYKGEDIDIDINVVVEYGTRINSVAESVANTVRFHVEKALGLRVNSVNVHVAGLRISDTD
ncbi:MAG: Asp23/Gls24 family envelope stress response protein [Anaerolineales bacterium]|uniref:Asp23/Gls24 family envelope stress response protein n=1 Tax=Candidatus Villigracilis affinis TaxID=3140682 RepID=UPI001DC963E6|nr:Asp23/Gls24 family envelope stress response protein [Anaerolineales bacterium]MBK9603290.1 Asp23/Gls24 family envelope stress response protein [Anaerolineales bacterium]MBL0346444.1 Asp23/Gls24 family envelope stress response protein [Anaerolineales bacterium]